MSDLCPVAVSQHLGDVEEQKYGLRKSVWDSKLFNMPETVAEYLLLTWKSKQYCDVTFTFPNLPDRIEAHEFCLKVRSPVFQQIFRMRKSGNVQSREIEISEFTPERFQQFLEFIYSDKFEVDIAGALDLLQLAQRYKIRPLTKKCEYLLQTEIQVEHSVKVFETARRYDREDLMERAGDIMTEEFLYLQETGALANAHEETVSFLLDRDELAVEEVKLFQFFLEWGRNQVGSCGDELRLKDILKNVIPKIRFTNMTLFEFTQVVVPTGLLSTEETLSVYFYFGGNEATRKDLKINFDTTRRNQKIARPLPLPVVEHFPMEPFNQEDWCY